jgi:uncharacterized protein YjcR
MVAPQRMIAPEIAETYGVNPHTVRTTWTQHPHWPAPAGKRGRYKEYDADAVAAFVREHVERHAVELEPTRLYTAQDLEAAGVGITAATIRAYRSRGRWPDPDNTDHGVNRWLGSTAAKALEGRRRYRRSTHA